MKRRAFLQKLTYSMAGLAGFAALIPGVGFLFSPFVNARKNVWRAVGKVSDFIPGTISEVTFMDPSPLSWAGVTAKTAAWLRRTQTGDFVAFSVNCTHLGCPVRWVSDADLFMCPCHGGVYTKDGDVAGGPPPKPLTRYQVRIDGTEVQIFTQELPIG